MMTRSESRVADESKIRRTVEYFRPLTFSGPSSTGHNSKKLVLMAMAGALACLALKFAVIANAPRPGNLSDSETRAVASEKPLVATRPAPQFTGKPGKVETEIITIRPGGFEPASIERPRGRFILLVDNRSGLSEVLLNLDREAGSRINQVNVPREKLDWSEGFDLPPGVYLLTEAGHPEWSCAITITAK